MNNIAFLFFCFFLCIFQAEVSFSHEIPQISIRFENQSLESALIQLESAVSQHEIMSEYQFVFQDTIVSNAKKINQDFKDKTIFQILDVLLANSGSGYVFLSGRFVIIYKKVDDLTKTAQHQESIQGKVVDENGKFVYGASIRIKEEDTIVSYIHMTDENCTLTDEDGSFIVSTMPSPTYIIVLYVGYLPRVVHIKDAGLIKIEPNLAILDKVLRFGPRK